MDLHPPGGKCPSTEAPAVAGHRDRDTSLPPACSSSPPQSLYHSPHHSSSPSSHPSPSSPSSYPSPQSPSHSPQNRPISTYESRANTENSKFQCSKSISLPQQDTTCLFPGIDLNSLQRALSRYNMAGNFGGPTLTSKNKWTMSFSVQDSGRISLPDNEQELNVQVYGVPMKTTLDMTESLQSIGEFALAAGRLYVTVVINTSNGRVENEVTMSGFWMDGDKFVTCAHFLDVIDGTDHKATKALLENSSGSRAFVSSAFVAGDRKGKIKGNDFWRVDLLHVNHDADIAVFIQNQQSPGHPKCFVSQEDITSIYEDLQISVDHKNLFAVYYPGPPQTVGQVNITHERKTEAASQGITDAFQFLAWESGQTRFSGFPNYATTFSVNTRSVAFGQITKASARKNIIPGRPSNLAHEEECDLVGYWGCSGGMICQFKFVQGNLSAQVIGLFRGEVTGYACNRIVVFTTDGVNELRKVAASSFLESLGNLSIS